MTEQTRTVEITFGLVQSPARQIWPTHGRFSIRVVESGQGVETVDMFSMAACRQVLDQAIQKKHLDSDQASELERQIAALGLAPELTRYDRLASSLTQNPGYELVVTALCQIAKDGKTTEPLRFKACEHSRYCRLPRCAQLPPHAVLEVPTLKLVVPRLAFSRTGAKSLLEDAAESGLVLPEETARLKHQVNEFSVTETAEQAERYLQALSNRDEMAVRHHLDTVFGFRRPEKPPRIEADSKGAYRLFIYDNNELGVGFRHRYDAEFLLTQAFNAGLIDRCDLARFESDVGTMNLPPGSREESDYETPEATLTRLAERLTDILMAGLH